jgi:hypothetical protein
MNEKVQEKHTVPESPITNIRTRGIVPEKDMRPERSGYQVGISKMPPPCFFHPCLGGFAVPIPPEFEDHGIFRSWRARAAVCFYWGIYCFFWCHVWPVIVMYFTRA